MSNTASQKQIDFINSLKKQRQWIDLTDVQIGTDETLAMAEARPEAFAAGVAIRICRDLWRAEAFDTKAASALIETLLKSPKIVDVPSTSPIIGSNEAPVGMHKFGGVIFKVQQSQGSDRRYAKALVEDGNGGWVFEYSAGAIKNLSESTLLPADEAAKFGQVYGICCNCARTLNDERSIAAGYGPKCAENNGWPWG